MTDTFKRRRDAYKRLLRRKIRALRDYAYSIKLVRPTAKVIAQDVRATLPGVSFTNVARDIRLLTQPGDNYDPEFDLLYRGMTIPAVVANYSDTYLSKLIKGIAEPRDMDERLARVTQCPGGKRVWEDL